MVFLRKSRETESGPIHLRIAVLMRGTLPLGLCKVSLVTQTRRRAPKGQPCSMALTHALITLSVPRMQVDP